MAKKIRKQYTAEQKYEYHKNRMNDKTVSENKRIYSNNWFKGYTDPYANNNYYAVKNEYERRKKSEKIDTWLRADYNGYINGAKAQLNNKKYDHRLWNDHLDYLK